MMIRRLARLVMLLLTCGTPWAAQADAAPDQSAYFGPASAAPALPDSDGFVRRWLVLDPIVKPVRTNQGFTADFVHQAVAAAIAPGPTLAVPHDGLAERVGDATLTWHALDAALFDLKLFNVAQSLGKPTYGVIFRVTTVIVADRDIVDAHLAVGSNSASMWWLNGVETAGLFGDRRMVMDDVVSPRVTLHKGRNVLRGAVINGPGLSDFCLRFVDDRGAPIRAFTIVAR